MNEPVMTKIKDFTFILDAEEKFFLIKSSNPSELFSNASKMAITLYQKEGKMIPSKIWEKLEILIDEVEKYTSSPNTLSLGEVSAIMSFLIDNNHTVVHYENEASTNTFTRNVHTRNLDGIVSALAMFYYVGILFSGEKGEPKNKQTFQEAFALSTNHIADTSCFGLGIIAPSMTKVV